MRRTRPLGTWLAFGIMAATLIVSGCSSDRQGNPLAPAGSNPDLRQPSPTTLDAGGIISRSKDIDGAVGGTVGNGRFSLTIPAGAFVGTRTISVQVSAHGPLQVVCQPEGLVFSVPASLTLNVAGTGIDASNATIFWWNPTTLAWVDMGGVYQSGKHQVTAAIPHFSTYKGGRSGW